MASSLTIEGVHAAYGAVRVIEDVSIAVKAGETVALLGTNGNGKSTLMKCVMGIVRPKDGRIIAEIDGEKHDLVGRSTEHIVDLGIALVPEGRRLFPKLTVEENLLLGAFRPKARAQIKTNLDFCFESFPRLAERRSQLAGSMSGGAAMNVGCRCSSVPVRAEVVEEFDRDPVELFDDLRAPFEERLEQAWRNVFREQEAAVLAVLGDGS